MDTNSGTKYGLRLVSVLVVALTLSCAKVETDAQVQKVEEEVTLASSSFFPGENAAGLRAAQDGAGEGGFIPGPSTGGSGDGGSIPAPGSGGTVIPSPTPASGSGGTSSGGTTTPPSGGTASGGTTNPPASGGTTTPPAGGSSGGTASNGATPTPPPAGSDGGVITPGGNAGGGDGGSVTPGSGSTAGGSTGGTSGGTSGGTASNGATPTPPPSSSGGTTNPPASGNNPPSGGTSGGTASNGGSTTPPSGSDGGSVPGGSTNPGGDGGSTTPPGGSTAGGGSTTPPAGGSSGGTASNGGTTNPPSSGGTNPPSGGTSGGTASNGTTPGSDGGTVPGGSTNPGGDGGTVPPNNPMPTPIAGNNPTPSPIAGNPTPIPSPIAGNNPTVSPMPSNVPQPPKPPTWVEIIKDILKKIEEIANGKPPADGGGVTPPGGNNPPDNGSKPCGHKHNHTCKCKPSQKQQKLTVDLARVCSAMRSNIAYPKFVFFEEAKRPILSIEAAVNAPQRMVCESRQTQWASAGYSYVPVTTKEQYNTQTGTLTATLRTVDLAAVDMMKTHFRTSMMFDIAGLKRQFTTSWRNILVTARVCEDRNNDGKCSDEKDPWVLSVNSPTFTLDHLPKALNLDVWNGRHLTRAGDPDVCEKQYSPLILDLTGEGFALTGPENGVYFDLNDTGSPIATGWTDSNNVAFLVRDLDRNGNIDSGAELFGSATLLENGKRAVNGFQALKDLDEDGDNKFTRNDSLWKSVKLWIDKNHNGYTDKGELYSLDQWKIESINMDYVDINEVDPHGNQTRQRSTYRRTINGKSTPFQVIDIWFNTLARQ